MQFASTAVDLETLPFGKGNMAPAIVCLSWADIDGRAGLLHHTEVTPFMKRQLAGGAMIIGHNFAYDSACLMRHDASLVGPLFDAYDNDRIGDTMIREQLIELRRGTFRPGRYSLGDTAKRRLGVELDKDSWREWYVNLRDKPLDRWPDGAKRYAIDDAIATRDVWTDQGGAVADEYNQVRAALWLHLCSVWGIRTDPARVEALAGVLETERDALHAVLITHGLVRPDGTRDMKAVKARVKKAYPDNTAPRTPTGAPKTDADTCNQSGDDVLREYGRLGEINSKLNNYVPLLRTGTVHARYGLAETGRTTCSPNVQNLPRTGGVRECFAPRRGYVFAGADYDGLELRTVAQACLVLVGHSKLAEALNAGLDPHLALAASILGISYADAKARRKAGDKNLDNARQAAKVCFHPDTEVLTRSGWVPIPNLQPAEEIAVPRLLPDRKVTLEWAVPLDRTTRQATELVHLRNESLDVRVTPDHRMAGWGQSGAVKTLLAWRTADFRYLPHAGILPGTVSVSRRFARQVAAVQADGSYRGKPHGTYNGRGRGQKIIMGFTKARKIHRMRWLFPDAEIEITAQGVTQFTISGSLADRIRTAIPEKLLTWGMLDWDFAARLALVNETKHWDSHVFRKGWSYCSVPDRNRDVLAALAASVGYKSSQSGKVLSIKPRCYSRGGNVSVKSEEYMGDVHCVTTHTDYVLVRAGGKTLITHQCNFGFPGGLGVERFVDFARSSYGVEITQERAAELKQQWLETWPEFVSYFNHISVLDTVVQIRSGRERGGDVPYTVACNSFFQGLGADAAKRAGWLIARACYTERTSPLYGSRIVLFCHDEFLIETRDNDNAPRAAAELARLMCAGANEFLPDVPATTEPVLMRYYSKDAKAIKHWQTGELVAWSEELEACMALDSLRVFE